MVLGPEIRELSPQPAVTEVAGLPGLVDSGFPRMFELGVPVGPDAAQSSGLPGGRAAVLRHVGPFSGLRDACERLRGWGAASPIRRSGSPRSCSRSVTGGPAR